MPSPCNTCSELSHGAGGDAGPHAGSLHALNEIIYQESRAQAEAARKLIPAELLNGAATDMGNYVRVWVGHSQQKHQCPAYKHMQLASEVALQQSYGLCNWRRGQSRQSEPLQDLFYPTYNCPLLKERLGRIGEIHSTCNISVTSPQPRGTRSTTYEKLAFVCSQISCLYTR